MGDGVGAVKVLETLVPDKRARTVIWVLICLTVVATAGALGYNSAIASDNARIDQRTRPLKVKAYENGALNRHVFEHLESQLPPAERHSADQIKREAHKELLEDEAMEKATEKGGD